MICLYYRWRISTALDRDQRPARLPHRHLRRCAACRRFHEDTVQIAQALRRETPPVRLAAPLAPAQPRAIRRWRLAAAGLAAAACVALAVMLAGAWRTSPGTPVVQNHDQTVEPTPAVPVLSTSELLAQAREPLESLALSASEPIRLQIERTQEQILSAGRGILSSLPVPAIQ